VTISYKAFGFRATLDAAQARLEEASVEKRRGRARMSREPFLVTISYKA
jgi:hypothetical protein